MTNKEEYAKSVCFFLAELLRTRKITLRRSAEIAQKIIDHINLIDSEEDFLRLIKDMTYDFEELSRLESRVNMHMQVSKRHMMEDEVREFVVNVMGKDARLALSILQTAVSENASVEDLCEKFPQFKEFIQIKNNESR